MKKPTIPLACFLLLATLFGAAHVGAQGSTPAKGSKAPAAQPQSSPAATPSANPSAGSAPAATNAPTGAFSDPKSKASYAIGLNIGKSMRQQSVDVDPNVLMQGLKDGLGGGKALMTDDEVRTTMMQLQSEVRAKM